MWCPHTSVLLKVQPRKVPLSGADTHRNCGNMEKKCLFHEMGNANSFFLWLFRSQMLVKTCGYVYIPLYG